MFVLFVFAIEVSKALFRFGLNDYHWWHSRRLGAGSKKPLFFISSVEYLLSLLVEVWESCHDWRAPVLSRDLRFCVVGLRFVRMQVLALYSWLLFFGEWIVGGLEHQQQFA